MPIPKAASLCWIAHAHTLPLPEHLARIGMGYAINDLHQRTFARPVFAQQGVDFAGGDIEVDVVVGQTAGVAFADSAQLQARCLHRQSARGWVMTGSRFD
jgi:hypothetical protein